MLKNDGVRGYSEVRFMDYERVTRYANPRYSKVHVKPYMVVGNPRTRDLRIALQVDVATNRFFHEFHNLVPFQLVAENCINLSVNKMRLQTIIGARISLLLVSKLTTVWSWHILSRY